MRPFPLRRFRAVGRFVVLLALAFTASRAFQSDGNGSRRPDIRVDVTLVRVPFVAYGGDGNLVRDLRPEELTVADNGSPQRVKFLWTESDLPLTIALLVDISSSQDGLVGKHRDAVQRFVSRILGPSDRVLLATLDEQPRLLLALTSSPDAVLEGAKTIAEQRHAGALFGEPCLPPPPFKRGGCRGTAIWDGVFHVSHSMFQGVSGRRATLLLSDGLDLNSSVHGLSSAIEASQSAGVTVYTVRYFSRSYLARDPILIPRALRDRGMERIAAETGGLNFDRPKDLDKVYDRIEEDLRNQYVLAYEPQQAPIEGSWHSVQVAVTRPGVAVRTQAGYRVQ